MSANSRRKVLGIYNSYLTQSKTETHPNMDSEQVEIANIDSDSNTSETHQNGNNSTSQ